MGSMMGLLPLHRYIPTLNSIIAMIGLIWTYCALNDFSRWAIQMMEASSDPSTSPASPLETRMREPPPPPPCLSVTLTQESRGSTLVLSLRTTTLS
uniref:Uncharacterized protein n=1 Tax=Triticum urartu TaxID=4572 RepID=A0A8R7PMW5_TRIUA